MATTDRRQTSEPACSVGRKSACLNVCERSWRVCIIHASTSGTRKGGTRVLGVHMRGRVANTLSAEGKQVEYEQLWHHAHKAKKNKNILLQFNSKGGSRVHCIHSSSMSKATRNRCGLRCKHLLSGGEEAEWTSVEDREINSRRERAAPSRQRQRLHSRRAPTCCHGNTTYPISMNAHFGLRVSLWTHTPTDTHTHTANSWSRCCRVRGDVERTDLLVKSQPCFTRPD